MKILSIRQPYAWAIAVGHKPVENRTWSTNYRGTVLIHAGRREIAEDVDDVIEMCAARIGRHAWFENVLASYRDSATGSARGAIVGAVDLVDCVTEMADAWFNGPFGFVFSNPRALPEPIPLKGRLGLFDPPADMRARLRGVFG